MRLLPLIVLAALFAGCVRPLPPPSPPQVEADFFEALADDLPEQSDELLWVVQRLANDGRLSATDVDDFHAAFPDVKSKNRALTEQDRKTLRRLR
jgi:hypothetical protein